MKKKWIGEHSDTEKSRGLGLSAGGTARPYKHLMFTMYSWTGRQDYCVWLDREMGYHTRVNKEEGFAFYSWIKGQVLPVSAGAASVGEQSSGHKYSGTENCNGHFLHTLSAPAYKPEGKTLPFPYEPQSHPHPPWDGAGWHLAIPQWVWGSGVPGMTMPRAFTQDFFCFPRLG